MQHIGFAIPFALACLTIAGCDAPDSPAPPPAAAAAVAPPPEPIAAMPDGSTIAAGRYRGVATLVEDGGGHCRRHLNISDWRVDRDQVRFGAFRGTARPDGSFSRRSGEGRVRGQFAGAQFTGRLRLPDRDCTYAVSLTRVDS